MCVNTELQIDLLLSEYHKTHFLCDVAEAN